jgi:Flp pilus assembly protein TadD
MRPFALFRYCASSTRLKSTLAIAGATLALAGCAVSKDRYAATEEAQQRQAFETANETKASANIDTQATYLQLVSQMQQQGLWFASLAHIDALEQRWGVTPDSTRVRADALRQTGQAVPAEAAYKRLMGTSLESAGYRGLGLIAGERGNFAESALLLRQAQRRTPTDGLLLSDLGYASLRAGQYEEARLPLMQALQLRPDSTQAQANLALYLELTSQRDQALALMDSSRMPEATRQAVRAAAIQMRGQTAPVAAASPGMPTVAAAGETSPGIRDEAIATPLALKASRWAGMGGVRTANQLNPGAEAATSAPSSGMTSRGTP